MMDIHRIELYETTGHCIKVSLYGKRGEPRKMFFTPWVFGKWNTLFQGLVEEILKIFLKIWKQALESTRQNPTSYLLECRITIDGLFIVNMDLVDREPLKIIIVSRRHVDFNVQCV